MVYVMFADGFEEIEALAVVDILRRGGVEVETVSVYDEDFVTGAHNIMIKTDTHLSDIDASDCDFVVLPGGMPGTTNLMKNKNLEELLIKLNSNDSYMGAICAAPMVLGQLGFLNEKTATCYPSFESYLIGASLSENRVCISNKVVTSRGAGTAHDFAFAILSILKGEKCADEIRNAMLYDC